MPVFSERDKEKIHWMLYDRNPGTLNEIVGEDDDDSGFQRLLRSGNELAFFQDVQRKTKLETNLDTSGMLSRNSFEVRTLRVVIAPLGEGEEEDEEEAPAGGGAAPAGDDEDEEEDGLSPRVIEEFIYNSVTTLRVGEKVYIEAPTFNFPAAAGSFGGNGSSGVSHGEPNPTATFRFAEPILIPPQQSFRVTITFPRGIDRLPNLAEAMVGVWVVLEGYLTRDVM